MKDEPTINQLLSSMDRDRRLRERIIVLGLQLMGDMNPAEFQRRLGKLLEAIEALYLHRL
jgi:hypothetical protein